VNVKLAAVPLLALGLMAVAGGQPPPPGAGADPGGPGPDHLAWPLPDWVETQPYGCTSFALEPAAPWCPAGHFHGGIDMAAPAGTAVHAAAAGRASVAWSPAGYGRFVVVQHGGGIATLYGHLDSTALRSGDAVEAGQEIGRVGSTGLSTGPHLHFEVRRGGRPVEPAPWLPAGR
jgi:murein DD-endopeptidase MepM/ murein hydrolase activator NlpD